MKLKFITNAIGNAKPKRITHTDGREYLIVPDVAIVEGVMNDVLYLGEEIDRYIEVWNGKPLTLGHPEVNGSYISANSPDQFSRSVGFFFNAHYSDHRLKGEWWIDTAKVEALGGEALTVLERLEAGQMVEQSTGLFFDFEPTPGEWGGVPYSGIARNLRPDHLAILVDDVGACSIADGCGAPRVNNRKDQSMPVVNVELSLDEKLNQVYEAWHEQFANRDVFETFVVAREGDKLFSYAYIRNDDGSITFSDPVEIEIAYKEVETGVQINLLEKIAHKLGIRKDNAMPTPKEKLIAGLVANKRCKFDQAALATWDEADLETLQASLAANADEPPATPPEPAPPAPETPETPPAAAPQLPAEITQFAEMLRSLGDLNSLKEALASVTTNAAGEREQFVQTITANSAFTADDLKALPLERLRALAGEFAPADYSGRGFIRANAAGGGDWEAYPAKEVSNNGQ